MFATATTRKTSQFLTRLTDQLDIPDGLFQKAEARYHAVADWLARKESGVADRDCRIYPQGSFLLGTVVKPVTDDDQYDIDLVCEVAGTKWEWSQADLKARIGAEIKAYATANGMNTPAHEGRRCWTLEYAEGAQFHMDILPALPQDDGTKLSLRALSVDGDQADLAIAITDNTEANYRQRSIDWPQSNPQGFAKWFRERGRPRVLKFAEAQIAQVPHHRQRTVLQRVVQVLKRHRDLMFAECEADLAPISVIISTLAARAYQGEEDLVEAVVAVTGLLEQSIVKEGSIWLVRNPVNPKENFADKWKDHPERKDAFFAWANQVRADFAQLAGEQNVQTFSDRLRPALGERAIDKALQTFEDRPGRVVYGAPVPIRPAPVDRFDVGHREKPLWPVRQAFSVRVTGLERPEQGGAWRAFESGAPLAKGRQLRFRAYSDSRDIDEVYWQVVNTGDEATANGQLRGKIVKSATAGAGGLLVARDERRLKNDFDECTRYQGVHWIECFIVKGGICVGRSGPFVVNIE